MLAKGVNDKLRRFFLRGGALLPFLAFSSVGFSSWIIQTTINPSERYFSADEVDDPIIKELHINTVEYTAGYGFVDASKGVYTNQTNLTGSFYLNMPAAIKYISSCSYENPSIALGVSLNMPSMTDFVYAQSVSISGFLSNPDTQNLSSSYSGIFNVKLSSSELTYNNIICAFNVSMEYTGSSFPDLNAATYELFLIPGECTE